MRTLLSYVGAAIALSLVGTAFGATSYQVVRPDPQALSAASKWLSVVDAGNYAQAYEMFPARIRAGGDVLEKQWLGSCRARRTPLGRMLSRKFAKAYFGRTLQGAPDGYYEFQYYNTSFQHKAQATEHMVLTKESGRWQVSGYRIH